MLGKRPDTPPPRLLRVDRSARPGWKTGKEQPPDPGQLVYCTEGMAEVVRVVGKTGDGSRLLELRLLEKEAPPFYAAASNVLVKPADEASEAQGASEGQAAPASAGSAGIAGSTGLLGVTPERPAVIIGAETHSADGAAEHAPGEEAAVGSGASSRSVFLDSSSWALAGSHVPGVEPLPGSLVIPGHTAAGEDAEHAPPPADEPVTPEPVSASTDGSASQDPGASVEVTTGGDDAAVAGDVAATDDVEEEDHARWFIIGGSQYPAHQPDGTDRAAAEPGKQPPTIPADPRVHWIG